MNAANAAARIAADIDALPARTTPAVRKVRRSHSRRLQTADAAFALDVARALLHQDKRNHINGRGLRWVAYELVRNHKPAFQSLNPALLEEFGQGIESWDAVDAFARTLSGPAWLANMVSTQLMRQWATSDDLWWRRAALVSTVALNTRSLGGSGDTSRTLEICRILAADHEDMVQKALSWALRELVWHDANAVRTFLQEHDAQVTARVKREVRSKLSTGLKNPRPRT